MKLHSIIAVLVCAALACPSAAQTRVAAGIARGPAGISVIPTLGGSSGLIVHSLNGGLLAPSMTAGLPVTPTPGLSAAIAPALVLSVPVLPVAAILPITAPHVKAAQALALTQAPAPVRGERTPLATDKLRADGENFWSGAAAKGEFDDSVPVIAPAAKNPSALARGAVAMSPAAVALPALPHWALAAVPYAEGAAALAAAYALTRVSRWAIDKIAPRAGWDRHDVVVRRFLSSAALAAGGLIVGLTFIGVPASALLAVGAGAPLMVLAISPGLREVAGSLFHGVHFLLARPYNIGDKVTIGKTTGVLHDLTLRYVYLLDESGALVSLTHTAAAAAAVKIYGTYRTKEHRATALWKPVLFGALAAAGLSFFPPASVLKDTAISWASVFLPYLKAGLIVLLTISISKTLQAAIVRSRLSGPVKTAFKLIAAMTTWIAGFTFLLTSVGISWALLPLPTLLLGILITDFVNAAVQCLFLLGSKRFQVGDPVTIGEHAGAVADITLQHVVLKLDEESFMLIPHSVVKDSAIGTPREYGRRRE